MVWVYLCTGNTVHVNHWSLVFHDVPMYLHYMYSRYDTH